MISLTCTNFALSLISLLYDTAVSIRMVQLE